MTHKSFDLDADIVELIPFVPEAEALPTAPLAELAFRADAWLPDETARLRAAFADDRTIDEIAAMLGRPRAGVATRIHDLGLRRNSRRSWAEWDDEEMARCYAYEPTATLAARLGRGVSALYARARLLDLSEPGSPPYSGWEDAQLRAGYEKGVPVAQIASLIGRPFTGIIARASTLGLRHACQPDDWSDAEMTRALELASTGARYVAIAQVLTAEGYPARNGRSLGQRLRKLGYGRGWGRPWIAEEDDLLRHAYTTGASLTPLRERLGRTPHSIRWRVEALGLRGTHVHRDGFRQGPVWTAEEEARLREDYGKIPTRQIADQIGRGVRAVLYHANRMGLTHGFMRAFSADEDRAIRNAWTYGVSMVDVAQALGRDPAVIGKHAARIGCRFNDPARPVRGPKTRRANRTPVTLQSLLALDPADAVDVDLPLAA
ncbi:MULTISPECIES: hypothetical protein [Sphingobium]|uniref:Uncharacterized protein n=3 Tax=Sphingobium TaxID=165695 RepID=T0H3Z1_9SPHN|nr:MULTISPECIES: hypothetical protein [Sphingobium]EQB11091.1 hypothetical protein RLDS_24675 [Sphingobium lactosutens DS20]MBB4151178.1 hypothetical protein [Sphingobium scionense]QNG43526.1 hypothetical protein H3V42_16275 [Sphingobium yanoikuyae]